VLEREREQGLEQEWPQRVQAAVLARFPQE
jgi:hypothetical protein